jgi:hypothetical protein
MRNSLQMQIFIVGLLFLRSRLVFNIGPLGSPTSRGEFETKPGRNLENQGASFPPGKQKQSFSHPGPFHEKRNNYVVLFPRFLVHFGAPGKQSLKSPCFVSSYFPCFNFFPTCCIQNSELSEFYDLLRIYFIALLQISLLLV